MKQLVAAHRAIEKDCTAAVEAYFAKDAEARQSSGLAAAEAECKRASAARTARCWLSAPIDAGHLPRPASGAPTWLLTISVWMLLGPSILEALLQSPCAEGGPMAKRK